MKKIRKIIYLLLFLFFIIFFINFNNNHISINNINYYNDYIDDYNIVHISDLHNKDTKGSLVKKIKKCNPDIIVFTGDISDTRHYDFELLKKEVKQISEIAPVYYINGNHEKWIDSNAVYSLLENIGINVLINENVIVDEINIIGLCDPYIDENFSIDYIKEMYQPDMLNMVLCHRPELFEEYKNSLGDLFLTGHAHGGQWVIPFTKQGLYAPNQGKFPKYTQGVFSENGKTMIVNRGIGNSGFPLRLFNTPEIININFIKNK